MTGARCAGKSRRSDAACGPWRPILGGCSHRSIMVHLYMYAAVATGLRKSGAASDRNVLLPLATRNSPRMKKTAESWFREGVASATPAPNATRRRCRAARERGPKGLTVKNLRGRSPAVPPGARGRRAWSIAQQGQRGPKTADRAAHAHDPLLSALAWLGSSRRLARRPPLELVSTYPHSGSFPRPMADPRIALLHVHDAIFPRTRTVPL
jgi:hypothetical protein